MSAKLRAPVEPGRTAERASAGARVLLVVPTSGRHPELLEETLRSLLRQHDEPAEIVLVARREAVEARELAARLGVAVVDDPGRGFAGAVNAGLALARPGHVYGNWIGEHDLLLPGALMVAAARLDARPEAVLAYGDCRLVTDEGHYFRTPHIGRYARWLLPWGPTLLAQPAALFRLADVAEVGYLDESLRHAMDLDLLLRLRRRGGFEPTGRTLATFRLPSQRTTQAQRIEAAREDEQVRTRYLTPSLRTPAMVWEAPLRLLARAEQVRTQRSAAWEL